MKEEVKDRQGQHNDANYDAGSVDDEDNDQDSDDVANKSVVAPIPSSMHFKATIDQLDTSRETTVHQPAEEEKKESVVMAPPKEESKIVQGVRPVTSLASLLSSSNS